MPGSERPEPKSCCTHLAFAPDQAVGAGAGDDFAGTPDEAGADQRPIARAPDFMLGVGNKGRDFGFGLLRRRLLRYILRRGICRLPYPSSMTVSQAANAHRQNGQSAEDQGQAEGCG